MYIKNILKYIYLYIRGPLYQKGTKVPYYGGMKKITKSYLEFIPDGITSYGYHLEDIETMSFSESLITIYIKEYIPEKSQVFLPKKFQEYLNNCEKNYGKAGEYWQGIGIYYYDKNIGKVVWLDTDNDICIDDEIIYNDFMKMNILDSMGLLEKCLEQ